MYDIVMRENLVNFDGKRQSVDDGQTRCNPSPNIGSHDTVHENLPTRETKIIGTGMVGKRDYTNNSRCDNNRSLQRQSANP